MSSKVKLHYYTDPLDPNRVDEVFILSRPNYLVTGGLNVDKTRLFFRRDADDYWECLSDGDRPKAGQTVDALIWANGKWEHVPGITSTPQTDGSYEKETKQSKPDLEEN